MVEEELRRTGMSVDEMLKKVEKEMESGKNWWRFGGKDASY